VGGGVAQAASNAATEAAAINRQNRAFAITFPMIPPQA